MSQPEWVKIGSVGDVNPVDYSGGFVYRDATGVYPEELEYVEAWDVREFLDENGDIGRWTVYRVTLERCTYVNGVLSDNSFHPEYAAWFADKIDSAAECCGIDPNELRADLCSEDAMARACAYETLASYFGWYEFDHDPMTIDNREEIEARYANATSEDSDEPTEPEEGDITTPDHTRFYQDGKLVLDITTGCGFPLTWQKAVRQHMDAEQFYPNVWFISDHGNAHLISDQVYDQAADSND